MIIFHLLLQYGWNSVIQYLILRNVEISEHIERFIMFSIITNIYNNKTEGPTLIELFTATGKLKIKVFLTTRDVRCVHHG
jgi:hypothetical protein